ncbi:hypothetical protein RBG61_02485 [Paludicola sp. MB14-C6]|uniref:hypothetical protein n=1 Tax=Paludihabitans sp. MB14-C6 TaxID=3070656 RepID=UPI0027DC9897|nr:hypothetical protein [Paludicola sp. MB14-C6]WMJ23560.1 hypothetical protein RBG61_02485 [Paludicola sp. MB14-C6]
MASQYEKDKLAKKEAAMVMKQKAAQTPQVIEKDEVMKPKTFKEKWQNYWYHYKIQTLLGALAVIMIVSLLWTQFTRPTFDASYTIVTESTYDGAQSYMEEILSSFVLDNDKNGKKQINVEAIMIGAGNNGNTSTEVLQMNRTKLIGKISKNDSFLYMVDSACYKDMKDFGVVFQDLSKLSDNKRVDGDKYSLKDSKFAIKMGMSKMFDDMYLCLIDFNQFGEKEKGKNSIKNAYQNDKKLLEAIMQYD